MSEFTPPVCYCGSSMELYQSGIIRARLRFFWRCSREECDGQISARADHTPLGIPANKETRQARIRAHEALDSIWQTAEHFYSPGYAGKRKRSAKRLRTLARLRCYRWLAMKLGIEEELCHMALFNGDTCAKVVFVCAGVTYEEVRSWYKANRERFVPTLAPAPRLCIQDNTEPD